MALESFVRVFQLIVWTGPKSATFCTTVVCSYHLATETLIQPVGLIYEPAHNKKSARASTHSDQCLRCPHEESLGPYIHVSYALSAQQRF